MTLGKPAAAFVLSTLLGCSEASIGSSENNQVSTHPDPNNPFASALCAAGAGGVMFGPDKRFLFGMNYAWVDFGADFGGISGWGQSGVASRSTEHAQNLTTMRKNGASLLRWWMMPDFRGDGVVFDPNDKPTGLGGTMVEDLEEALRVADAADMNLMLCLFSFDAFFPTRNVGGQKIRSISPIVRDTTARAMLIQNVIRPLASVVRNSPHARRLLAWDVINEPEWAMMGSSPYGDPNYDPMPTIDPMTHHEMETFVQEVAQALHEEGSAYVTVGSAGAKWAHAWKYVDIDFYQLHVYDWVDQVWPYDNPPSAYDLSDKPVVIGEFPGQGLSRADLGTMLESLYQAGYAGAMPWDYQTATRADLATMATFATNHACGGVTSSSPSTTGTCVDVPPDNTYTCEQQAGWGKCNEPWMQGFCLTTCGPCP